MLSLAPAVGITELLMAIIPDHAHIENPAAGDQIAKNDWAQRESKGSRSDGSRPLLRIFGHGKRCELELLAILFRKDMSILASFTTCFWDALVLSASWVDTTSSSQGVLRRRRPLDGSSTPRQKRCYLLINSQLRTWLATPRTTLLLAHNGTCSNFDGGRRENYQAARPFSQGRSRPLNYTNAAFEARLVVEQFRGQADIAVAELKR